MIAILTFSLTTHPSNDCSFFFFFNDTATTEIYPLSLHDALPISPRRSRDRARAGPVSSPVRLMRKRLMSIQCPRSKYFDRSEEHTSELQSQSNLVCRLLLEKKNKRYWT